MKRKRFAIGCSIALLTFGGGALLAAPQSNKSDKKAEASSQRETVAKPMTEKQRKRQEERLRKELETPYKKWLNEDVSFIITDDV